MTKRTGKQVADIFAPTTADGGHMSVELDADQIAFLDELAALISRQTGTEPDRGEVIGAVLNTVRNSGLFG